MVQRTVGVYYVIQGSADDTMNLGGIKIEALAFNVFNPLFGFHGTDSMFLFPEQTCSVEI